MSSYDHPSALDLAAALDESTLSSPFREHLSSVSCPCGAFAAFRHAGAAGRRRNSANPASLGTGSGHSWEPYSEARRGTSPTW
jgi:hypothetical protein